MIYSNKGYTSWEKAVEECGHNMLRSMVIEVDAERHHSSREVAMAQQEAAAELDTTTN